MGMNYSVGAEFISDTAEHTGRFNCIYFNGFIIFKKN